MTSFSSVPVLDLSLSKPSETKPQFLNELRTAVIEVGFAYIKNTGIDPGLIEEVKKYGKEFFDIPVEEKMRIEMKNCPHFLGYSKLGNEITKFAVDYREQWDAATEKRLRLPDEPRYKDLEGPNLWPSEDAIPGFRKVFEEYINQMAKVALNFTSLIAEAIGLEPDAFDRFFDGVHGDKQQHRLKIIKYPDLGDLQGKSNQGVGPHKDSMFSSYLLQVTQHRGLQVQNIEGTWIDCPPIDGTLVFAIGQGMEAMTQGVCVATTHRVLSPDAGSGPRFSIPFFQGTSLDSVFESVNIPEATLALKREILKKDGQEFVEMTFSKERYKTLGEATLMNRVKSHPDVGEKYYPDLLKEIHEYDKRTQGADGLMVG